MLCETIDDIVPATSPPIQTEQTKYPSAIVGVFPTKYEEDLYYWTDVCYYAVFRDGTTASRIHKKIRPDLVCMFVRLDLAELLGDVKLADFILISNYDLNSNLHFGDEKIKMVDRNCYLAGFFRILPKDTKQIEIELMEFLGDEYVGLADESFPSIVRKRVTNFANVIFNHAE